MEVVMYKTYSPLLYGIVLRFTENTLKADEILENSFAEISLHLPEFNGSDCRLFTWMMRITLNECIKAPGIPSALLKIQMMPFLAVKSR